MLAGRLCCMCHAIPQVLDYVTSVLMGGGKGFLPHLHAGITTACLLRRLGQPTALTSAQPLIIMMVLLMFLVASVPPGRMQCCPGCSAAMPVCTSTRSWFLQGAARLLALLLPPELATATAAQAAIKSSIKKDRKDRDSAAALPDPQHSPAAVLDSYWPAWHEALLQAVLLRRRKARYTHRHELQQQAVSSAATSAEASAPADVITPDPATALDPESASTAGPAAAAPAKIVVWVPAPVKSALMLVLSLLQQALTPDPKRFNQARLEEARVRLLQATVALLKDHAGDAEQATAALQQLHLKLGPSVPEISTAPFDTAQHEPSATLLGHTFTLQRSDVPDVLQQLGASYSIAQPGDEAMMANAAEGAVAAAAGVTVTPGGVTPSMLHALAASGGWRLVQPRRTGATPLPACAAPLQAL